MKSFLVKYKALIILVILAMGLKAYDHVSQLIMNHDVETSIDAFDSSGVTSVSVTINTIPHAISIKDELQDEMLNLIFDFDYQLGTKKSFVLQDEKLYRISFKGETQVRSISLYGQNDVTIEVLTKDRSYKTYALEVNWNQTSYDSIVEIIKESR